MSWIFCNPNPMYNLVEDCTVRAISIAMNQDWHTTYLGIAMKGNDMCNMPLLIQYGVHIYYQTASNDM